MVDSEKSISSEDSKNINDSKLTNESNKISIQELIDNQFDELENWVEEQIENVKKGCKNAYNNFRVNFKNIKKKENIINKEEDISDESD